MKQIIIEWSDVKVGCVLFPLEPLSYVYGV